MSEAVQSFEALRFAISGHVALLTLDRPAQLNALDRQLKRDLRAAFETIAESGDIRAVVLTGSGRAFCAGQDLREVEGDGEASAGEGGPSLDIEALVRTEYIPLITAMRELEKPIVAAVNGPAVGAGFSLAVACDVRIAAEGASFTAGFGRIGLVPDSGVSWLLPRLVGLARSAEILLAGETIDAARAERIGLVSRVVPADRLADEAMAVAGRLAEGSPLAVGLTKRELVLGQELSLDEALDLEARLQGVAGRSADHAEGLAAFRERRAPRFEGR